MSSWIDPTFDPADAESSLGDIPKDRLDAYKTGMNLFPWSALHEAALQMAGTRLPQVPSDLCIRGLADY